LKLSLLVIFLSGLVTAGLTPLVIRLAYVLGAVDDPGGRRKIHTRRIPRLGGVAIFFPVMLSLALGFWIVRPERLVLARHQLFGFFVACACIFLLGVYDDIRGANAPRKLTVQICAATLLYVSGVRISEIATPFDWTVSLGIFAFPFTVLWLVGLTNGMNLLDGIDGLAAGVAAIGALTILAISVGPGGVQVSLMAAALLGSLLGFLVFNFYPAQIFLGDCGALFLGFFLASLSVLSSQKTATAVAMMVPFIALGIPIFDTLMALIRRILRGKAPFQADRDHLHHRLLALGLTQPQVSIALYIASGFLAIIALLTARATRGVVVLVLFCLTAAVVEVIRRLKMREFQELWRLFRYGERRRRPPRYRSILVRNTLPLLERCENGTAIQDLLDEVRRDLGFDTLRIRLDDPDCRLVFDCMGEVSLQETKPSRNSELLEANGEPSWAGTVEIACGMPVARWKPSRDGAGNARVVGELVATKPAWKTRRASEKDEELLQLLADALCRSAACRRSCSKLAASRQAGNDGHEQAVATPGIRANIRSLFKGRGA
jgi:UDP-GlcNAc:undecaprenyl-phosphate GlcNAc-1-phosphate transferase